MHAFSQAALKLARIDLWGRSEPGNTHLILIERKLRAGILTPPGRVVLRQCSSRRGKRHLGVRVLEIPGALADGRDFALRGAKTPPLNGSRRTLYGFTQHGGGRGRL
jgi:hypothetical protein